MLGKVASRVKQSSIFCYIQVVRSPKYDVAVSKEIPIMTNEWVTQVWERGKHDNIHATNPTFTRYKCPALMGLTLTVSQMGKKDKEILKKSIESHGGTYTGQLDMEHTEILIISKPEGDKYKYAKKWKIPLTSGKKKVHQATKFG